MCAHNKPVLLEWVDLCTYFHLTSCQKESGWLSFDINVQRHLPPWTVYIHQQPVVYTIPLLGFRLWSLYITVSDDIVLSLQLTANLVNFLFPIWGVLDCSCYTPQGRRVRQTVRGVGVSPGFFFIWWSWPRWVSWWIAMPVSARYFNEQEEDRLWKKKKQKQKKTEWRAANFNKNTQFDDAFLWRTDLSSLFPYFYTCWCRDGSLSLYRITHTLSSTSTIPCLRLCLFFL